MRTDRRLRSRDMWYLALGYSGPHARYIDRASESIHFGVTVGGTGVLGLLVLILLLLCSGFRWNGETGLLQCQDMRQYAMGGYTLGRTTRTSLLILLYFDCSATS
jgi:hypothetical protein